MHDRTAAPARLILLLILLGLLCVSTPVAAAPRCFPETGFCLDGRIREYWEANGGLPIFGFPISAQGIDAAQTRRPTQWTERNRFELHPDNAAPYDVLLGRLGDDALRRQGRDWQSFPRAGANSAHYFTETGHAIAHPPFWQYWSTHGLDFGDPGVSRNESLALFGLPLSEPALETNANGDTVLTQWFERARLEDHGADGVLLGLLGSEVRGAEQAGSLDHTGIWISPAELAALPTEGSAWKRLKAAADGDLGKATLADMVSRHDVNTLAVALVYARTGEEQYRKKAADAIRSVVGTEDDGDTIMLARNLVSYIITADLIDLGQYAPEQDRAFREWLAAVRSREFSDGSLISEHERRANNHGTMPGASRAAIAVYLGDSADLARTAQVFRGWVGDRSAYADFNYPYELSWQADPGEPVAINRKGASRDGHSLDGALPEEMRRGCSLKWPPCPTGYPWEALQGAYVQAMILSRQGYDVWSWEDQALLRAVQFLYGLDKEYGGWAPTGDDTYLPWLVNHVYGTDFATGRAGIGKNMGWTDWMYGGSAD